MGAGSLLALMSRRSLLPARQLSKLAPADIAFLSDYDQRPSQNVNHAQLTDAQAPPHADTLHSFHVNLAERLQQLQLQAGTRNTHLNWLLDALASTLSTHSSLLSAFAGASSALSTKHRADEVLSLLDVCTALKQVADDMDRQFGCLQHALKSVGQALKISHKPLSSSRLRAAARRLSACISQEQQPLPHFGNNLLCIMGKYYRPLAEARSSLLVAAKRELQPSAAAPLADPAVVLLSQALDGAMLTSLLVLASVISSFAPPSQRRCFGTISGAFKTITKYLSAKSSGIPATPWNAPLRHLHHDLRQEGMSGAAGCLFGEIQGLQSAALKLYASITAPDAHSMELAVVKQSVESLCKSLQEVQLCTSMLRMQLASFFQALIALRLALLNS